MRSEDTQPKAAVTTTRFSNWASAFARAAMERSMACGMGVCLGCVVETTSGYKTVCRDGPVFPLEQLVLS